MDEFYQGLSAEQKAKFCDPLSNYSKSAYAKEDKSKLPPETVQQRSRENALYERDVAGFEKTLNPRQLEQWKALRAEANNLGSSWTPEHTREKLTDRYFENMAAAKNGAGATDAQRNLANIKDFFGGLQPKEIGATPAGAALPEALREPADPAAAPLPRQPRADDLSPTVPS